MLVTFFTKKNAGKIREFIWKQHLFGTMHIICEGVGVFAYDHKDIRSSIKHINLFLSIQAIV